MALGKQQRERLDKFIAISNTKPEIVRYEVIIERPRQYTREFGSGMWISVTVYECYEEGEYRLTGGLIANCHYDYTAIDKGKEIANYLVNAGVLKDRVKLAQRG